MNVFEQNVPTGGIVGVRIVGCENLTCESLSSPEQPVLYQGDEAEWLWDITAGAPGSAEIRLRIDTYDKGSQQVLSEEILRVNITVVPTAAYERQQSRKKVVGATNTVVAVFEKIGIVAGAIVAVGGIVGWIIVKKRRRSGTGQAPGGQKQAG